MILALILFLWVLFFILSFGVTGLRFIIDRRAAAGPWMHKIDKKYMPSVSFLVPTYNENHVIQHKLENLARLDYPKNLVQIIIVDSNSSDHTLDIAKEFVQKHSEIQIKILIEKERLGKSAALNSALEQATGELVIVSDADCFYPNNVLRNSLPYLSDLTIGAISGQKCLLNEKSSGTVKNEAEYLKSANLIKLGESKAGFTPLFEGGFSAYRKTAIECFDPYFTGSDDCGTLIKFAENSYKALYVPEAVFFTTFPVTLKGRLGIKIRRANQLIRVFSKYLRLLITGRIKSFKSIVLKNTIIYLFCPIFFVIFLGLTVIAFAMYPLSSLLLISFFLPKVGTMLINVTQGYLLLFFSLMSVFFKKGFLTWKQPADRHLLTEIMLKQNNLI